MKILFCSDGSPAAEQAVRFGALIAAAQRATTTILGISETTADDGPLRQSLGGSQEILRERGLDAELIIQSGRPVVEIARRVQANPCDLVVIGAAPRGRGGSWRQSRRAYRIIEAIAPPVLVVPRSRAELRRILLCSGGRPQTDRAIELVGDLAARLSATVTLFHVLAAPPAVYADLLEREEDVANLLQSESELGRCLRQQQESLAAHEVSVTVRLRHGLVVPELLAELRQTDYDLVVSGSSPSADKLRACVLGNLTREIVWCANTPVLVVRTGSLHRSHPMRQLVSQLFGHPRAAAAAAGRPQ